MRGLGCSLDGSTSTQTNKPFVCVFSPTLWYTPLSAVPNTHLDHSTGLISSLVVLQPLPPIIPCCESLILAMHLCPLSFFHFHLKEWASLGSE